MNNQETDNPSKPDEPLAAIGLERNGSALLAPGWHWWHGRGNDKQADGLRPVALKQWCVLVWPFDGEIYASSACWVAPLKVADMGGEWLGELRPPNNSAQTAGQPAKGNK